MQNNLFEFDQKIPEWKKEWIDMPEYNNIKPVPPEITATFKFRNKKDFDLFMETVKVKLFDGKRVFDGKQKKNEYSAWFPLDSRPSENIYVVNGSKCEWCNNEAEIFDYREIDGMTKNIKTCSECFELNTHYLIKRQNEK